MEEQVPQSTPPSGFSLASLTPEQIEQLKAFARERAIQTTLEQQKQTVPAPSQTVVPSQRVVYVRRNLTVAELILVFALSCGLVVGLQAGWGFASNLLPRIEVKVK
jgi:hypothetical protein